MSNNKAGREAKRQGETRKYSARVKRQVYLLLFIAGLFFILILRVGYVQLIKGPQLKQQALRQWTRDINIMPKRGTIYDRNGYVLAESSISSTIVAYPNLIKEPEKTASALASVLDMKENEIFDKIGDSEKAFAWIERQVPPETGDAVRALKLKGISVVEEPKRYYPNKDFATQVLGFTAKYPENDGIKGLEGLELYYNKYLMGTPGREWMTTDSVGRELPYNEEKISPPQNGLDLVLTIDQVIQDFAEEAVESAMQKYKAQKAYAIVMNPQTGEILAMANRPSFDLNNPPRDIEASKLQALSKSLNVKDNFEPGSTFKLVVGAAGLEEGVVSLQSTFEDPGYRIVDGQRIRCDKPSGHGHETLTQGFENSCNSVFIDIALGLGKDKLYDYIQQFGFGQKTGIDMFGEERGLLISKKRVKDVDLARIGFGQAIAVTPIQMITAVSAVVNGGRLMVPHLAKEFRKPAADSNAKNKKYSIEKKIEPKVVRRVLSKNTSDTMRGILQNIVENGTGQNAQIPGYNVGGKTGTAQKYENGRIKRGAYVTSFIGIAPMEDPQLAVYFIVDEPKTKPGQAFGATVAAPYAKEIMENALKYLGIPPSYEVKEKDKKS